MSVELLVTESPDSLSLDRLLDNDKAALAVHSIYFEYDSIKNYEKTFGMYRLLCTLQLGEWNNTCYYIHQTLPL